MEFLVDRLRAWRSARGLRALLIDLDDTLVDTEAVFVERFAACVARIAARRPELAREEIADRLAAVNVDSFDLMGANLARRWPWVAATLRAEYAPRDARLESELRAHLLAILASVPAEHPGASDTLRLFRAAGFAIAIVTHACERWTDRKLAGAKLAPLVDRVHVVDEDARKDAAAWTRALEASGIAPGEALVVGDSLRSDVGAAHAAGVRRLVWVRRESGWHVTREGALPEGALAVASVGEVAAVVLGAEAGAA